MAATETIPRPTVASSIAAPSALVPRERPPTERSYQPLVVVLAAICVGITWDKLAEPAFEICWLLALAAWFVWCRRWLQGRNRRAVVALWCALLLIAAAWHHLSWKSFADSELGLAARNDPLPICLEGRALDVPRRIHAPNYDPLNTIPTSNRTRLELRVTDVRDGDHWRPAAGITTVVIQGDLLGVRAGDRVRVVGQLFAIGSPSNPGEHDYAATHRAQRRLCTVHSKYPECVTRLSAGGWNFANAVDWLRAAGIARIEQHLDAGNTSLALGMFLGLRQDVEPEYTEMFQETGMVHLLVISGLHVAILSTLLFWALRLALVPERAAIVTTGLAILLYAIVTGGQPPVVRGTVMVLVACAAKLLGRRSISTNTLAAAAILVLAYNPCDLFGVGAQLSFLGALAIAVSGPLRWRRWNSDPLARLIAQTRPWPTQAVRHVGFSIRSTVIATTLIWLFVAPLVMARFHLFSPVSIVLAPLMVIPIELAMASGFALIVFGWLVPPLGRACGWICDANLALIHRAVEAFRSLPGSYFWVPGPGEWWLAGYYAGLLAILAAGRYRPPRRWCVGLLAVWCLVGVSVSFLTQRDPNRLDCTFLSVGHGLAVVLQLPHGQTILYDAGQLGAPQIPTRTIAGYLWSQGIMRLDAVVLSHADADHYNALPGLLKKFSVGRVYVSSVMFDQDTGGVKVLHDAIRDSGVPLREVWNGDRLPTASDCRIEVLHPPRGGTFGNDNANCIVLAIEYAGRRLLLTGDLEGQGLSDVLAEEPYHADVLLVPHHGSLHSNPRGIADWSRPTYAIMSGALRDRHDEVAQAYERHGSRVLHTANTGAVHVSIANGKVEVDTWREIGTKVGTSE